MKTITTRRVNADGVIIRRRVRTSSSQVTRTAQAHRGSTNINSIMKRFRKTGELPINERDPKYGDFTSFQDYHDTVQKLIDAENDFNQLPAETRKRFANDPGEIIAFLQNPENMAEAIEIGLIPKPEPEPDNETIPPGS